MRAMRRAVSGVAAAAGLLGVLVGAPWALFTWGRPSLLWSIDWARALAVPDDGRLVLGLLSLVGWVAWLALALSVLVEVAEQVDRVRSARAQRPHRPLRLPGLELPRLLVRGLVISAVTTLLGVGLSRVAAAEVPPRVPAAAPVDRPASGVVPLRASGLDARRPSPLRRVASEVLASAKEGSTVVVQRGDSLWKLAAHHLGSGERWPEIFALNEDLIEDPDLIYPGWRLRLPHLVSVSSGGVGAAVSTDVSVPPGTPAVAAAAASGTEPARPIVGTPTPTPTPVPGAEPTIPDRDTLSGEASAAGAAPGAGPNPGHGDSDADAEALSASQALALGVIGTVGAGLAAALVRTVRRRRDVQLALRPPGRRILFPSAPTRTVESALAVASLPTLDQRLQAVPPSEWTPKDRAAAVPAGAVVTAGLGIGGPVDLDLEAHRLVTIDLGEPQTTWGTACAWALELACGSGDAGTSRGATIVAAGAVGDALAASGLESVVVVPTMSAAVDHLVETVARQQSELEASGWSLDDARRDRDARDAWWPTVYVLGDVDEASLARADEALRHDPRTAVSAILVQTEAAGAALTTFGARLIGSADRAVLEPQGTRLRPVSLSALGAAGVVDLLRTAGSDETPPAPWYAVDDAGDNVLPLLPRHAVPMKEAVDVGDDSPGVTDFSHPTLMLLGPIKLLGAAGPRPARAERSCIEYCAWMVEHPGATASHMAGALLVAEGTRRSNVSRLRGWLGTGPDGTPYLPEAYTGRLYLDPLVSSDWQRLQALVSSGVNRVPVSTLVSALKLVRGAPLADAAPGQWHWAEELRTDMVSVIRDIGVRVGEVALAEGDIDLARWAAARALVAAPGDELLMKLRLRTEHRAGNRPEVERIVLQLVRHARVLGIDLDDDTVAAIQEAIEGRPRARA